MCAFTEWGEWSKCTKTCSSGNQARRRTFILSEGVDSVFCDGNLAEVRECNADIPCPGMYSINMQVNCVNISSSCNKCLYNSFNNLLNI